MTATSTERIYMVGGTGFTGKPTTRALLKAGIPVTLLTRSAEKAAKQFSDVVSADQNNQELLTFVEGDYDDLTPFKQSIAGHTRLFLAVGNPDFDTFVELKRGYASAAYAAGVKQIVDISGTAAGFGWRTSPIAAFAQEAEATLLEAARQAGRGYYYVALRPARFMSNTLLFDIHNIKGRNAILEPCDPDTVAEWVSPNDIGAIAAIILQEPLQKHKNATYELISDYASPRQRAKYLSDALGREIVATQVSSSDMYKFWTEAAGLPHLHAYDLSVPFGSCNGSTERMPILLGREPETLEHYIHANKAALL